MTVLAAVVVAFGVGLQEGPDLRKQIELALSDEFGNETRKLAALKGADTGIAALIEAGDKRTIRLLTLLAEIGARQQEGTIAERLSHPDPAVRVAAAGALGMLRAGRSKDRIAPLLRDAALSDAQKGVVARVLGELDATEVLPDLQALAARLRENNVREEPLLSNVTIAVLQLETCTLTDAAVRQARLIGILQKKHAHADELRLRLWSARKLADYQCAEGKPALRMVLLEEGGDEGQKKHVKTGLLTALKRLGAELDPKERQFLREQGVE